MSLSSFHPNASPVCHDTFLVLIAKLPEFLNFQSDVRWCTTELQNALSPTPRQSWAWFASVPGIPRVNAASHTGLGSAQKLSSAWIGPLRKVAVRVSDTLSINNKTYESFFSPPFFFFLRWGGAMAMINDSVTCKNQWNLTTNDYEWKRLKTKVNFCIKLKSQVSSLSRWFLYY